MGRSLNEPSIRAPGAPGVSEARRRWAATGRRLLLVLAFAATWSVAQGETAYVIDRLLVGIHQDKKLDSPIIKVLPTGTELEVLERDGDFAKVRTTDGTSGWIDASYIMTEKPAQLVVRELEAKHQRTTAALETARIEVQMLKGRVAELEKAGAGSGADESLLAKFRAADENARALEADLEQRDSRASALQAEVRTLEAKLEDLEQSRRSVARKFTGELEEAGSSAAAKITALEAKIADLESSASTGLPDGRRVADRREIARLEADNRRLAAEVSRADRRSAPGSAPGSAPEEESRFWRLENVTFLLGLGPWQLAVLGFIVLLVFGFGGYLANFRVRRRYGGFRF